MQYIFPPFFYSKFATPPALFWLVTPLLVWTAAWKGLALWRSARNYQKGWFITLLIVNTLGLLEILYLFVFSKPKPKKPQSK